MAGSFKEITTTWQGGTRYQATAANGTTFSMGAEGGFSAMDTLLVALAGCTGADVASILEKKRQAITGIDIHVRGQRAEEHPMKYTEIEITFTVTGHGVDPEAVQRAIELSETRFCSVSATLNARVHTRFDVREAEAAGA